MESLTTYRYGSPRSAKEGVRIGVARQPPRGIRKEDWQRLGYCDVRVPLLAPSPELIARYRHGKIGFPEFSRHYQTEMKRPESRQAIELLAALLPFVPMSLGCFCEDETKCHRIILRKLVEKEARARGAAFAAAAGEPGPLASPACYAHLFNSPE